MGCKTNITPFGRYLTVEFISKNDKNICMLVKAATKNYWLHFSGINVDSQPAMRECRLEVLINELQDRYACCLYFSRNMLSVIPPTFCQLEQLQVLLASNNRLVSLPEEIGRLRRLQQLVCIYPGDLRCKQNFRVN